MQAVQVINNVISVRNASTSVTGVASFNATRFSVNSGAVDLTTPYQVTGDTVLASTGLSFTTNGNTKTLTNTGVIPTVETTYTARQNFSAGISSFGATFDNHIVFRKKLNDGSFIAFPSGFMGDGSFRIGFGQGPYLKDSLQALYPNLVVGNGILNNSATGSYGNLAVGFHALMHTGMSGSNNTAIGSRCLMDLGLGQPVAGYTGLSLLSSNSGIGAMCFDQLQIGYNNVGVGYLAGSSIYQGSDNVLLGGRAGFAAFEGFPRALTGCILIGSNSAPRGIVAAVGGVKNSWNEIVIGGALSEAKSPAGSNLFGGQTTHVYGYNVGLGPNTTTIGNTACIATLIRGRLQLPSGLSVTGSIRLNTTVVSGSVGSLVGTDEEGAFIFLSTENFTADNQSILYSPDGPLGQFVLTNRLASTSLTGVASFNSADFIVSSGGHVRIADSNEEGTIARTNIAAPTQIFSELQRFSSGISSTYLLSIGGTFDGNLSANLFIGNIAGGTF